MRKRFHDTHEAHKHSLELVKALLIVGMIVMAVMYRYTGFIDQHPDLFALEITTYAGCSLAAYLFFCFMRNNLGLRSIVSPSFWVGAAQMVVFTVIVVASAELAGMNTKFVHDDGARDDEATTTPGPVGAYREEALRFKEEMWDHMIVSVCVMFVMVFVFAHMYRNDRGSFLLLVAGGVIAGMSMWSAKVREMRASLIEKGWLPEDTNVTAAHLGLAGFFAVLFVGAAVLLLLGSLARYDSFKIYSYFADNPAYCGVKRSVLTVALFVVESLVVAFLFAVPILYVGSNRNKPELGKEYRILQDKEVFTDLGLLTFKIFVFLVALQATGFFDASNKGFCRKDGCNVRIGQNQQCVSPS